MMSQLGFGNKWRFWIRGCLASLQASILINGSPTKEFQISKGVRRGDPLSPFLFIIAMEGLHAAMKSVNQSNLFHGVKIPNNGPTISHLFYADDVLFVGEWRRSNFVNLSRILRSFHSTSGLKVNFHKSMVFGIGVQDIDVSRCARVLGCDAAILPFIYLGVPVGTNMVIKCKWSPIIERI